MALSFFFWFCWDGKRWETTGEVSHFRGDGEHTIWLEGLAVGISAGSIGDLKIFQCISALEMWAGGFWRSNLVWLHFWKRWWFTGLPLFLWEGTGDWWLKICSTSDDVAMADDFSQRHLPKGTSNQNSRDTLRQSNIAMENGPFEDVFPIKNGDIPWLCYFTRGYWKSLLYPDYPRSLRIMGLVMPQFPPQKTNRLTIFQK